MTLFSIGLRAHRVGLEPFSSRLWSQRQSRSSLYTGVIQLIPCTVHCELKGVRLFLVSGFISFGIPLFRMGSRL